MSGNGGFQEKALQNRSAIAHISPTSNERMSVKTRTLDGRAIAVPPHQVAVLSEQPKVVYVNPQTAVPSAWAGSETFIDFQIPPELHILTGLTLRLPISVGAGTNPQVPATPWWVSRIEVQAGKDTIETLYPEQLYFDSIAIQSNEQNRQDADRLRFADLQGVKWTDISGSMTSYSGGSGTTTQNNPFGIRERLVASTTYDGGASNQPCHYLPIHCSLTQAKVFVSGFITPFRLRVYFPSVLATASGTATITLSNSVQLYCVEQELSAINYEAKLREHRNGAVSYKVIIKDRYVESIPGNLATSTSYNQQLKAFKSLSAGLLVYVFPQGTNANDAQAKSVVRLPLHTLELRDNVGRRMTETLRSEWLRWNVWNHHFYGNFAQYVPVYVIPFSSDLGETLKNGVNLGYEQLTTLEQLIWETTGSVPDTSTSSGTKAYSLNITSFNYAMLECQAGVPRVVFT